MSSYIGKLSYSNHGIQILLKSYQQIKKYILKLTQRNLIHSNDISYLITESSNIPKRKQRQIKQTMQIQLANQLKNMYKNYNKKQSKIRKYELFSHSVCYFNLISSKIKDVIPQDEQIIKKNSNLIKWKLFLSEINELKDILSDWMKVKFDSGHQKNFSLNKDQNCLKINHAYTSTMTRPSTAVGSFSVSQRPDNNDKQQQKQNKKRPYLISKSKLKRCSTAKIFTNKCNSKQEYKMAIRCPSATLIIKSDKKIQPSQSSHLQKQNNKKLIRKGTLNVRQPAVEQNISFQNLLVFSSAISKQPQTQKNKENLTINQQIFQNQEQSKLDTKNEKLLLKPSFVHQRRSSLRKLKNFSANHLRSNFTKPNFQTLQLFQQNENQIQNQGQTEKDNEAKQNNNNTERFTPRKNRLIKHPLEKKDKNKFVDDQNQVNNNQLKQQFQLIQEKKSLHLSLLSKVINQINKDEKEQNLNIKKTNRRNGQLNSPDLLNLLTQVQKQQQLQKRQQQQNIRQKTLTFNLNLIEDIQMDKDQRQSFSNQDYNTFRKYKQKFSANHFYRYLSQFKQQQTILAQGSLLYEESIFFNYQDALREEQGRNLQRHIKKLRKKNQITGEVFQIRNQQSNSKYDNYMLRQRNIAFFSDNDWLNNFQKEEIDVNFLQKQLDKGQNKQIYI